MDAVSEGRLAIVHPQLAGKVRQMADMLALEGVTIKVTQGLRSWTDQLNLWLKGRDVDGNVVDASQVVTKAPPGHSYHNFGLAVDVAPFTNNTPNWNLSHPVWKRIVAVGESVGLASGSEWRTFPDWPHFQLTGKLPVSPDDEVRQTFKDGGNFAVWEEAGLEDA
jgi:peptidoglycan L-alanyl-D-glutamate endopeptidase CwlK